MEEKEADALEMAAQANEEREKKKKDEERLNLCFLFLQWPQFCPCSFSLAFCSTKATISFSLASQLEYD